MIKTLVSLYPFKGRETPLSVLADFISQYTDHVVELDEKSIKRWMMRIGDVSYDDLMTLLGKRGDYPVGIDKDPLNALIGAYLEEVGVYATLHSSEYPIASKLFLEALSEVGEHRYDQALSFYKSQLLQAGDYDDIKMV